MKAWTACGKFCYNILVESASTTYHAARISWVQTLYPSYRRNVTKSPLPNGFTGILGILDAKGLTDSSSDSAVQTAVDAILNDKLAAYLG